MRTLLLSDIQANLPALEVVLSDADGLFDATWVLGDTIGYGADPSACIGVVRDLGAIAIAGNHEEAAIGRMSTKDFNPVAREAIEWTANALNEDEKEYVKNLELTVVVDRFTLVHGSPRDPVWEYIETAPQVLDNLEHFETQACAIGHSHMPFTVGVSDGVVLKVDHTPGEREQLVGDRLYINPGSVGQPRDLDNRASYALLDLETWDVEFRRVEYDIPRAQARIRKFGLPEFLAERLELGQ
jgi:diadenosine tetraphosphatase ApaH/serine/threonine PP2A family protein phosphatase